MSREFFSSTLTLLVPPMLNNSPVRLLLITIDRNSISGCAFLEHLKGQTLTLRALMFMAKYRAGFELFQLNTFMCVTKP